MKCYKQINENGEIVSILGYDFTPNITDLLIVEITTEEYKTIFAEMMVKSDARKAGYREKKRLVNRLYRGKITIDDIPEEWRDKIQSRVNTIIAEKGEYIPSTIALKAKAYDIITGVAK